MTFVVAFVYCFVAVLTAAIYADERRPLLLAAICTVFGPAIVLCVASQIILCLMIALTKNLLRRFSR